MIKRERGRRTRRDARNESPAERCNEPAVSSNGAVSVTLYVVARFSPLTAIERKLVIFGNGGIMALCSALISLRLVGSRFSSFRTMVRDASAIRTIRLERGRRETRDGGGGRFRKLALEPTPLRVDNATAPSGSHPRVHLTVGGPGSTRDTIHLCGCGFPIGVVLN